MNNFNRFLAHANKIALELLRLLNPLAPKYLTWREFRWRYYDKGNTAIKDRRLMPENMRLIVANPWDVLALYARKDGRFLRETCAIKMMNIANEFITGEEMCPPILIVSDQGEIGIEDGHHRIQVSLLYGLERVPFLVTEEELFNLGLSDLEFIEAK